ncbi:MAG TPA: hypothetical protein VNM66_06805 [Thermodesulfobacteriota bacterium]|nr:hypothetical protein [Thermodesulfobacteriota bacterium]
MRRNRAARTNLLEALHRPLGARLALAYECGGDTSEQPQSRWVLSRVELDDGHPGDRVDVTASTCW